MEKIAVDEMHIWTERVRRKRMRNMFSTLRDLLPPADKLPLEADKSSIVDEAVKYIKTLKHTLQSLENRRVDKFRSCSTSTSTIHDHDPEVFDQSRESILYDDNYQGRQLYNFCKPGENTALLTVLPVLSDIQTTTNFQTWLSPNVVVNMCGNDAQIRICSRPRKPRLLATIFCILEKHNLDVISAHIYSNLCRSMYMIHAHAGGASE